MSNIHETPVRTSQRTYFASISKKKRLILYREVISHYPENPRKAHKCWELQSFSLSYSRWYIQLPPCLKCLRTQNLNVFKDELRVRGGKKYGRQTNGSRTLPSCADNSCSEHSTAVQHAEDCYTQRHAASSVVFAAVVCRVLFSHEYMLVQKRFIYVLCICCRVCQCVVV